MSARVMGLESFSGGTNGDTVGALNATCVDMFGFNVASHTLLYIRPKITIRAVENVAIIYEFGGNHGVKFGKIHPFHT